MAELAGAADASVDVVVAAVDLEAGSAVETLLNTRLLHSPRVDLPVPLTSTLPVHMVLFTTALSVVGEEAVSGARP